MTFHVSVCIVGFRNAGEVTACVGALAQSDYADYDVIVCENGGPAGLADLQAHLPAMLPGGQRIEGLLGEGNPGYAASVNQAIRARPDADAWWIINPDTIAWPNALDELVTRLRQGDVQAVGGQLVYPDGSLQSAGGHWRAAFARAISIGKYGTSNDLPDDGTIEGQLDYLLGASMLVSREFVERNGLMREDYFLYGEEIEWCLRAARRGLRIGFARGAMVVHRQGGTTGSDAPLHLRPRLPVYLDERNKLHIVRDTTPLLFPLALISTPVLSFLRYGARGAWKQWGFALAGWRDAVRGLRGKPRWLSDQV